jgi:hypothetical protein
MGYADPEMQRAYQRQWYQRRHAAEMQAIGGGECAFCGSTKRLVKHHIDPEDKVTHQTEHRALEVREAERGKCIVLCKRCHDNFHAKFRHKRLPHGTEAGYQRGCRCRRCVERHGWLMAIYESAQ